MNTTHSAPHQSQIANRKSAIPYDIFLVGVGGQGILTIAELIAETALRVGLPVNFYPSKGMAQRGGFVKGQVRLGRARVGPNIPERGANLVIAMEVSEALKAVRYVKPGGDFVLYGDVWSPTTVVLGRAAYPSLDAVSAQIRGADARLCYVDPGSLPLYEGAPAADNVYVLGVALARTGLSQVLPASDVAQVIRARWHRGAERNAFAFQAGLVY